MDRIFVQSDRHGIFQHREGGIIVPVQEIEVCRVDELLGECLVFFLHLTQGFCQPLRLLFFLLSDAGLLLELPNIEYGDGGQDHQECPQQVDAKQVTGVK